MRTDIEIRTAGIQTLLATLGDIEAERFLMLINREKFDYTQWRSQQWRTETVASLAVQARGLRAIKAQEK
jgi:hypothetical protein